MVIVKPRLHYTTCCQTGLTTGCIVYTVVQPGLTTGWMFVFMIQPAAGCIV